VGGLPVGQIRFREGRRRPGDTLLGVFHRRTLPKLTADPLTNAKTAQDDGSFAQGHKPRAMSSAERTLHVTRTTSTAHRLLHYDGACDNVHGHNLDWEVEVALSMAEAGEANMPVDLKDIADTLDRLDHAVCLNYSDPLAEEPLGLVVTFDGDPTCEHLSQRMAEWVHDLTPPIRYVAVTVNETDTYGVSATYAGE